MKNRPHILLFNPDQWRGDTLGHTGNPAAETPNLDRMVAGEAVSFSNAFCQNPVCTPSRCSFMTGWYPHVRGHRTMYHMLHADRGEPNLQRELMANGYFVWWTARNDLAPAQLGFDDECDVRYIPRKDDYKRWGHTPRPGLPGHGVRPGRHRTRLFAFRAKPAAGHFRADRFSPRRCLQRGRAADR
ncbi:MAG: sulfatase-like hydrolase/transferase, partial [Deltaproteobacteria bacterium]|nr:sulfatase-like hydrolase/transferase [Deltaproteobacteria bacterium]